MLEIYPDFNQLAASAMRAAHQQLISILELINPNLALS